MGSNPDLTTEEPGGISREGSIGSFYSMTSGTSTYYSAKEDLDSQSFGSGAQFLAAAPSTGTKKSKGQSSSYGPVTGSGDDIHIDQRRMSSSDSNNSNSTTIDEADMESLRNSSEEEHDVNIDNRSSKENSSSSDNAIEVREDISRICNTIAESEEGDRVKRREIEEALSKGFLGKLRELAISEGGLLSNALRTRSWPLLLSVSPKDISQNECKRIPRYFPDVPEKINNLVHLDVNRVLKRFPPGLTDPQQDHLQSYLTNLICSVLQEKRQAYYYQGFHDISLTFLLVSISQSAPYLAYLCLNKMIESNLAPYMEKTMDKTHDVLHVLFALIEAEDPALYKRIVVECKCPVAFCLPWVLTWFSHTLPNDTDVFRLSDYILGSQEKVSQPYLLPIFISASLILRNAKKIKENDELTDIASMHHTLSRLPSELESLEPWLKESSALMKKYSGKSEKLLRRGLEIKALQNRLWNEDTNNNRRRPRPIRRDNLIVSVGKFLFVRHKWATVSIVVLGTAFLLQSRYGRSIYNINAVSVKSVIQSYTPEPLSQLIRHWFSLEDQIDE